MSKYVLTVPMNAGGKMIEAGKPVPDLPEAEIAAMLKAGAIAPAPKAASSADKGDKK